MYDHRVEELAEELLHAAQILNDMGCLPATDGNFSARIDKERVLLTARGIAKRDLMRRDLVEVRLAGDVPPTASTEWPMHRTLYQQRPEVNCVLHVHSPALTAFAAAHKLPRIDLLAESMATVGPIALAPFASPGTAHPASSAANGADPIEKNK